MQLIQPGRDNIHHHHAFNDASPDQLSAVAVLGLGPKEIGQLGGGKKTKLTGQIDLATLQALTRADNPAK
ncbi:MAG TPA: hypothetical protein VE888_24965, partial [Streptosporangiaceae bacterium]|nr:hypothetical protein [Streptosporangiaceae bacterium]